jgi:hypothetical protein
MKTKPVHNSAKHLRDLNTEGNPLGGRSISERPEK